jgi:predicted acetyltransferase
MELYLKKIELSDKEDVEFYLKQTVLESGSIKGFRYDDGLDFNSLYIKIKEYENIPFTSYEQSNYPSFQYLIKRVKDNALVGALEIRPYLTRHLDENFEGNVGYGVLASERGKGYASLALALAKKEFYRLTKQNSLVICCYKENEPSKRVILKNGGKLIEEVSGVLTAQKYKIEIGDIND